VVAELKEAGGEAKGEDEIKRVSKEVLSSAEKRKKSEWVKEKVNGGIDGTREETGEMKGRVSVSPAETKREGTGQPGKKEREEREMKENKGKKEKKGREINILTLASVRIFCDRIRAANRALNFNCLNIFIFRTNSIIIFLSYQIN
jgi:hypothetical protein